MKWLDPSVKIAGQSPFPEAKCKKCPYKNCLRDREFGDTAQWRCQDCAQRIIDRKNSADVERFQAIASAIDCFLWGRYMSVGEVAKPFDPQKDSLLENSLLSRRHLRECRAAIEDLLRRGDDPEVLRKRGEVYHKTYHAEVEKNIAAHGGVDQDQGKAKGVSK